jgi:hypothetical protein
MRIKRLKNTDEIKKYVDTFSSINGYQLPYDYFLSDKTIIRAIISEDGRIYGGYAIIGGRSRSIEQIPSTHLFNSEHDYYLSEDFSSIPKKKVAELTGYFMKSKTHRFRLTALLVIDVFFKKENFFAYSYTTKNVALGNYYKNGNPITLYVGKPKQLEGHPHDLEEETVEILSKTGILKVFLARVKNKYLR